MNWEEIKNAVWTWLTTAGLNILEAIGVFLLGFILIKIVVKILNKIFAKTKMPKVTYKFLITVLKFGLYLLLMLIVCQMIGIPTTGFIAVVSAASLALSLALQGSLSNLANGVVLISTRPFNVGDYILINGVEGTVKEIKMLHTIISTTDNKEITIPNSKIVESELTNFSMNKTRKVVFNFGVDYATDVDKAKEIILNVMRNSNKVLLEKDIFCALKTLDASSINLFAYCWCLTEDYWTVYYEVMDKVFNEFKRENISIPFNQLEVRMRTDSVVMPYRQQPLDKRDENVAVKLVEEKHDMLGSMMDKIKHRKHKNKKTENTNIEANTDNTSLPSTTNESQKKNNVKQKNKKKNK